MRVLLLLLTGLAVLGGALRAGPAASGAGAPPGRGKVLNYFETSTRNGTATVVVTGSFTDYGLDKEGALDGGTVNEIVLKHGSFDIDIAKLDHAVVFSVDDKTCAYIESGTGPARLLGGTGAYAGIRGTITITVSGRGILPTSSTGACEKSGSAAPLVAVSTAFGSGTVSL
jgi:hypothetical protein